MDNPEIRFIFIIMKSMLFNKKKYLNICVIVFSFFIFSCEKSKSAPMLVQPKAKCLNLKIISDKSLVEHSEGNFGATYIYFTSGFDKDTLSFVEQGFFHLGELNSNPSTGLAYLTVKFNDSYITSFKFKLNNCVYILEDIFSTPAIYINRSGNTLFVEHSNEARQFL